MRCCSAAMDILLEATPESPPAAPLAGFASAFCNRFMRSLQHTVLRVVVSATSVISVHGGSEAGSKQHCLGFALRACCCEQTAVEQGVQG